MGTDKSSLRLDWQHVALLGLSLLGAGVCMIFPDFAKFVGPIVSAVVPIALAKHSPLGKEESMNAHVGRGETVIINVGSAPAELSLGDDGDLKIRWQDE